LLVIANRTFNNFEIYSRYYADLADKLSIKLENIYPSGKNEKLIYQMQLKLEYLDSENVRLYFKWVDRGCY
jgi:hypothetical protein